MTMARRRVSSQHVIHRAAERIRAGVDDLIIVGGVESMSQVPTSSSTLVHCRFGASEAGSAPANVGRGIVAELVAARWKLGRQQLDDYAARSRQRAEEVAAVGEFQPEIAPVTVWTSSSRSVVYADETVQSRGATENLATFPPLFHDREIESRFPEIGWHITEGNSSRWADGASAMIIASERRAAELGLQPWARFVALAESDDDLTTELCGPIRATRTVLKQSGIQVDDLDHYEISEAFASIPLAWQYEFAADSDRLNPRGGAIALGHPIGASGVRSMATMLNALEATGGRLGLQAMEGAGSTANVAIIEKLSPGHR